MTMSPPNEEALTNYDNHIQHLREHEYPMLKDALYLDHAGTTLYSKTSIDRFHSDMISNLYGNPHSASPSSQLSSLEVESVRLMLLRSFDADPDFFDLYPNPTHFVEFLTSFDRADVTSEIFVRLLQTYHEAKVASDSDPMR